MATPDPPRSACRPSGASRPGDENRRERPEHGAQRRLRPPRPCANSVTRPWSRVMKSRIRLVSLQGRWCSSQAGSRRLWRGALIAARGRAAAAAGRCRSLQPSRTFTQGARVHAPAELLVQREARSAADGLEARAFRPITILRWPTRSIQITASISVHRPGRAEALDFDGDAIGQLIGEREHGCSRSALAAWNRSPRCGRRCSSRRLPAGATSRPSRVFEVSPFDAAPGRSRQNRACATANRGAAGAAAGLQRVDLVHGEDDRQPGLLQPLRHDAVVPGPARRGDGRATGNVGRPEGGLALPVHEMREAAAGRGAAPGGVGGPWRKPIPATSPSTRCRVVCALGVTILLSFRPASAFSNVDLPTSAARPARPCPSDALRPCHPSI